VPPVSPAGSWLWVAFALLARKKKKGGREGGKKGESPRALFGLGAGGLPLFLRPCFGLPTKKKEKKKKKGKRRKGEDQLVLGAGFGVRRRRLGRPPGAGVEKGKKKEGKKKREGKREDCPHRLPARGDLAQCPSAGSELEKRKKKGGKKKKKKGRKNTLLLLPRVASFRRPHAPPPLREIVLVPARRRRKKKEKKKRERKNRLSPGSASRTGLLRLQP